MPSIEDIVRIQQMNALYGHVIDERQWSRLGEVFHKDIVCDFTVASPKRVFRGLDEIRDFWMSPEGDAFHPLAHHATNCLVLDENPDGTVNVISKGIGVGAKGRVGSVTYRDKVVRTPDGWRMLYRRADIRKIDLIPDPS